MTLLSLSPEPPVWAVILSQSLLILCPPHTCVHTWPRVSSLCCKRYSVFVLYCAWVCVWVLKQEHWYDVECPEGRGHSREIIHSNIFLTAFHTQPMYKCQTCASNCLHLERKQKLTFSSFAEFLTWPSVLSVEGPDSNRCHEAWTSEEVNVRDQQAALHRLAARPQACKALPCSTLSTLKAGMLSCGRRVHMQHNSNLHLKIIYVLGQSCRLAVSPGPQPVLSGSGAERVRKHWLYLWHQPWGSAGDWHH